MIAERIDVLAVMERDAIQAVQYRVMIGENVMERATSSDDARAAVGELIGATIEFRACLAALIICQEQDGPEDIYEAISERYLQADKRCDAALARIGAKP